MTSTTKHWKGTMMSTNDSITFRKREFKGSRLRCLLATSQEPKDVAAFLTSLVQPHAIVTSMNTWAPRGFCDPNEAKLSETDGFLSDDDRETMTKWWLAVPGRANTPNWDLISQCTIEGQPGLILVEAKAHEAEFEKKATDAIDPNLAKIKGAIAEANNAWNQLSSGFALYSESFYQLSNRFAFAWKLASMGVPVVLVYLGFLNAEEMTGSDLLRNDAQWRECVKRKSQGIIPADAWERTFDVQGTPLTVLIRTATVRIDSTVSIVPPTA
jgi:hypothetical protein